MVSLKKVTKMARKWQKMAAKGRKRIQFPPSVAEAEDSGTTSTCFVAERGHFVVYTMDRERFVFPIAYLSSTIFVRLFRMSEEEFGLPGDGPITLPCDAVFMEYVVSLMQRRVDGEVERALFVSLATSRCSLSSFSTHQEQICQQVLVSGY